MAAMPELRLQVAFENDPNADPPAFSDISDRLRLVHGINARRGRQYELDVGQPGTAAMVTLNDDGALTPGRATSPWWPHVAAGRKLRLSAVWEGIEYPLATTFADSFGSGWPNRFAARNLTALNGTDLWKRLSRHRFASQLAEQSLAVAGSDIIGYLPLTEPAGARSVGDISTGAENLLTLRRFRFAGESSFGTVQFASELDLIGADGAGAILLTPPTVNSGHYLLGPLARDIPLSGEFSVSMWLTQAVITSGTDHSIALQLGNTAGENNFIFMAGGPFAGTEGFAAYLGGLSNAEHPTELADGLVHHAVATVQDDGGSNRTTRLYVDGVLSAETPSEDPTPVPDDSPLVAVGVGNLGGADDEFPNGFWNGLVSHVMVVGRRLTDAEVAQIYSAGVTGLPAESVGSRITRILDFAGTTPGAIDSGKLTVGGQPLLRRPATDALNELATVDGGLVSADPDGEPAFHSQRNSRRRVAPKFILDAAAGEVQGLDFSDDDTLLVNDLTYTGSSGATGRVTDADSIIRYTRFRGQADLPLATDNAAAARARRLVRDFGQTRPRTQSIEIDLVANPHLFHALLAAEMSDRFDTIGLPANAPALSMPWLVEQIEHRVTEQSWVVAIQASPYDTQIRPEDIMDVFTVDGTWTKPAGLTFVRVRVRGGGGAGGGSAAPAAGESSAGAGGGEGEYAESILEASALGATETVTVGAGGTGSSGVTGGAGGTSSFGTHVQANGGSGGNVRVASALAFGAEGGVGGTGGTGQVLIAGEPGGGAWGHGALALGGNGGGAGGLGKRQTGSGNAAAGGNAPGFGGGGGGASSSSTGAAAAGGGGRAGQVIVENYFWHPEGS